MRPINEIIVHCTATKPEFMPGATTAARVAEVKRWHIQDRGWKDIGYHWLIDRDGTVAVGRPVEQVGAHVQGHNTGTIGISLFGGDGSNEKDAFAKNFTFAQEVALRKLIADLRVRFPAITKVTGHNQYAAKACPGFNAPLWYASRVETITPTARPIPTPGAVPVVAKPGLLQIIIAAIKGLLDGIGKGKS